MILPTKADAIIALVGGQITLGSDGSNAVYHDGQTPPTEAEIKTKFAEIKAEYDAQEYARSRKLDYPEIGDQLDYIFHNGVDKWKEDIVQPVKDKYPKG